VTGTSARNVKGIRMPLTFLAEVPVTYGH